MYPSHVENSLALPLACFSWLFTICGSRSLELKLFLQFLCNRMPLYIYGVKAPSGISSRQIPDLITYQLSKESSLKLTSTQLLRLTSCIKFPSQAKRKSPCLVTPFRHYHLLPQSSQVKSCCSRFEIRQMVVFFWFGFFFKHIKSFLLPGRVLQVNSLTIIQLLQFEVCLPMF